MARRSNSYACNVLLFTLTFALIIWVPVSCNGWGEDAVSDAQDKMNEAASSAEETGSGWLDWAREKFSDFVHAISKGLGFEQEDDIKDAAVKTADTVHSVASEKAGDAANYAYDKARDTKEYASQMGGDAYESAKTTVGETYESAKETVGEQARTGYEAAKEKASQAAGEVGAKFSKDGGDL